MGAFFASVLSFITSVGAKLLFAALIIVVGRFLINLAADRVEKHKFSEKTDPTAVRILENFTRIGLYILLGVAVIGVLGVPTASIVAAIASAGLAIGLALQGALSNLAGGIMILLFRPFRIGDFVEANGHTGTVTDIGVFYTFITTPDNKVVTIPNGSVMGNAVINYSSMDTRRVDIDFSVAYGTDVERVKALILDEADKHALVLKTPEPFARLSKENDSSLDFTMRVWAKGSDYWTVYFDMMEAVHNRLVAEGIEIPFKQLDVNIRNQH